MFRNPHYDPPDWPYGVQRPAEGQVRACPICGAEVIFSCYHYGHDTSSVVMDHHKAKRLREESGEYRAPMTIVCDGCGEEKPVEAGCKVGGGVNFLCSECA